MEDLWPNVAEPFCLFLLYKVNAGMGLGSTRSNSGVSGGSQVRVRWESGGALETLHLATHTEGICQLTILIC